MEMARTSEAGSVNCGGFAQETAGAFQFLDVIQGLMTETYLQQSIEESPTENGGSFTTLMELPENQALQLLHDRESGERPVICSAASCGEPEECRKQQKFPLNCSPIFPPNAALVDRAARFYVSTDESVQTTSGPSIASENSSVKYKIERAEPDNHLDSSPNFASSTRKQVLGKRKGVGDNTNVKAPAKRSKKADVGSSKTGEGSEKLPYVHVRARRGQATDSHSLAERARREKINARMKLLQELVPGCNKISGTALVLDEIINHVQSLQQQVEVLSMRLATINSRVDFGSLNSFFGIDSGDLVGRNVASMVAVDPMLWPQRQVNGTRRQHQSLPDNHLVSCLRDDNQVFLTPESCCLDYDSTNAVSQQWKQMKMEV